MPITDVLPATESLAQITRMATDSAYQCCREEAVRVLSHHERHPMSAFRLQDHADRVSGPCFRYWHTSPHECRVFWSRLSRPGR